jgi:hypothetical protein
MAGTGYPQAIDHSNRMINGIFIFLMNIFRFFNRLS